MFVLYNGSHPQGISTTLEEVPEGEMVYYFPQPDLPVPVIRAGNRLLYPEPDGTYRYWVTYERTTRFALPPAEGDAFVVFYDPLQKLFGLEVWQGRELKAREVLHTGPLAKKTFLAIFGRNHEQD